MTKNASTEAQRRYIESLARDLDDTAVRDLLAPAFALNSNTWKDGATLNQNLRGLSKTAASRCIDILKNR